MTTYRLIQPLSTKLFDFNKFLKNLDLEVFLNNPVYRANVITLL